MPLNVDLLTVREISLELLGQDRGSGESPNQLQSSLGELLKAALVPVGNSHSYILMVQPAQDGHGQGLTDGLHSARDRRVLIQ